jgi:hypothetical protein
MAWIEFKMRLVEVTSLSQDALHIYAAILIQLAGAIAMRRSLASPLPWLAVLSILLVNEAVDIWLPQERLGEWQILAGLRDLWNTMILPTFLMILARFVPSILIGPAGDRPLRGQA